MKKTINILAIMLSWGTTYAQQAPKTPASLQFIMDMAGKWEGPAILKMGGQEIKTPYYAEFMKTADNNGIYMLERCNIPGIGALNGANLIGFDPNDSKIHWYSVDNMGTTHEHIGDLMGKQHFNMVYKGIREGKTYTETIDVIRTGKDKVEMKLVATIGGQIEQEISASFHRKTATRKKA